MDYVFEFLFSNPYVPYLLAALVVLVLYQQLAHRLKIRLPGVSGDASGFLTRLLGPRYAEGQMLRAVNRYKKQAHFLAAGKLLEDNGRHSEAAEAYLEGHEFWAAASVYERLGKVERAAELYLQAGDHKKAAQLLEQAGRPGKAAALFLEKGNSLEAARLFAAAGEWGKAADLYSKGGYDARAAEAYEKKGDFLKAAEAYEKHFMENVSYSTTYSSTAAPTADQRSSLQAGRLYEKAGDLGRALTAFTKGGYHKEAASACMALGQYAKAAEYFLRAEDPESAADAHEKAGDQVAAANLRGEVALRQERIPEAAAWFQKGHDFLRSAELFESVDLLSEAAGAYEAGESWAAAGSVYIRAGMKGKAAASYEKARDFETAAKLYEEAGLSRKATELFEKAGFTFKSGEAAAHAGDKEKAIALLQRVPAGDENYRHATELLARLFIEGGKPGLALERLQRTLGNEAPSASNLELHYWIGIAQEAAGQRREALETYRKVLAEDLRFRDVEKRAAALEAALAGAAPAAAPAGVGPGRRAGDATPGPPAPAAAGGKSPRFVIKEELGRGALGVVHRGEDTSDGRSVALRMLPSEMLTGHGVFQALAGDLRAVAGISHPNVVKLLGLVDLQGRRCVVSEFVPGRNFAEALATGHRMTMKQAHSLGRVLAQVLATLHEKNLVHGSIQPSNIMVANAVVKVADAGLGRLAHTVPRDLDYRAPENQLDAAGDLYAMAAVLYHLLTGVHPKSQPQGAALPLPSSLAPGVSEPFDKLLLRCLHPRPSLRFASADEVLGELKDMVRFV